MTKTDTFNVLNLIEKVYPLVTLKSETIILWLDRCESMDYSMVLDNLAFHMRSNPYPPTLNGITGKSGNKVAYFAWLDEYLLRPE